MAFDGFKAPSLGSIKDTLLSSLGLASGSAIGTRDRSLPWSHNIEEAFFNPMVIDQDRWNRMYPYRLLVVDVSKGSPKVVTKGGASYKNEIKVDIGGLQYFIAQERTGGSWEYVLPITPQQLQITDVFSIETTATMRGVVEEHSGVRFKTITMSGTTGIWARKPTKANGIEKPSSWGSLLGGTFSAFDSLKSSLNRLDRVTSGKHPNEVPHTSTPKEEGTDLDTGYYQALFLGQFLEQYAQAKKKPENKGWRLVLDIPKQNQSFVVTPISFNFKQNAQKPNEMLFDIQLKAWKRIFLNTHITNVEFDGGGLTPNILQSIIGTIRETRRVISSSVNLVRAVRSNFREVYNIIRQTSLVIKDLTGLANTVADMPHQLVVDLKDAIYDIGQDLNPATGITPKRIISGAFHGTFGLTVGSGSSPGDIAEAIRQINKDNEGVSNSVVKDGGLGTDAAHQAQLDPLNAVFQNPEENFSFFDTIQLDSLKLSQQQLNAVEDELARVRLITISDLRDFRKIIFDLTLDISNSFGSGDSTYSDLYGRQTPRTRATSLTLEEDEIMQNLFNLVQQYDTLVSSKWFDHQHIQSPLEYVGGLANEAGINFEQYSSKRLVPVPFGSSIEEIAARYLGNPDKWIELATINQLKSPYIDENGYTINFLSNAQGRQFNVENADNLLFIGQVLVLQSSVVPSFTRKIINLEKIGTGNWLVTVDGLADLDNLTTVNQARMKGYLPGTVNSQNQIYIPTNQPTSPDDMVFDVTRMDQPNLTKVSKIDFLLTDDFDIALTSDGDFRLSNGLNNLVQAMKIKIRTKKGTLLRHLDFGLGLTHGVSVADITSGEVIESLNKMVEGDPRFDSIDRLVVSLDGSSLLVEISVKIANSTGVLPITFDVKVR